MKKWAVLIVAIICAFSLAGCNRPAGRDRLISVDIGGDVTKVDMIHYIGGKSIQWTAEGQEVDNLRVWASGLEYELFKYEEGQSPGDSDGGEVYIFTMTEGDNPGFSYFIRIFSSKLIYTVCSNRVRPNSFISQVFPT